MMNGQLREHLRQARDAAVRERIAAENEQCPPRLCVGCGTATSNWTLGCRQCAARHIRLASRPGGHPYPYWYRAQRQLARAYSETRRRDAIYRRHHQPREVSHA